MSMTEEDFKRIKVDIMASLEEHEQDVQVASFVDTLEPGESKSPLVSKTMIFNFGVVLAAVLAYVAGQPLAVEQAPLILLVVGVINIVLRSFTTVPVDGADRPYLADLTK